MSDLQMVTNAFVQLDAMREADEVPFSDAPDALAEAVSVSRPHAVGLINLWQLTLFGSANPAERAAQALAMGAALAA